MAFKKALFDGFALGLGFGVVGLGFTWLQQLAINTAPRECVNCKLLPVIDSRIQPTSEVIKYVVNPIEKDAMGIMAILGDAPVSELPMSTTQMRTGIADIAGFTR